MSKRVRAILPVLVSLATYAVFVGGYVMGASSSHPNSLDTWVAVGIPIFSLLAAGALWCAAREEHQDDTRERNPYE